MLSIIGSVEVAGRGTKSVGNCGEDVELVFSVSAVLVEVLGDGLGSELIAGTGVEDGDGLGDGVGVELGLGVGVALGVGVDTGSVELAWVVLA